MCKYFLSISRQVFNQLYPLPLEQQEPFWEIFRDLAANGSDSHYIQNLDDRRFSIPVTTDHSTLSVVFGKIKRDSKIFIDCVANLPCSQLVK